MRRGYKPVTQGEWWPPVCSPCGTANWPAVDAASPGVVMAATSSAPAKAAASSVPAPGRPDVFRAGPPGRLRGPAAEPRCGREDHEGQQQGGEVADAQARHAAPCAQDNGRHVHGGCRGQQESGGPRHRETVPAQPGNRPPQQGRSPEQGGRGAGRPHGEGQVPAAANRLEATARLTAAAPRPAKPAKSRRHRNGTFPALPEQPRWPGWSSFVGAGSSRRGPWRGPCPGTGRRRAAGRRSPGGERCPRR
jgi:hypothetical protein